VPLARAPPLASFHRIRLFDEAIYPAVSTEFVRMDLETVREIHESGFACQAVDSAFGFCFGFVHANQKLYVFTFFSLAHKPQTVDSFLPTSLTCIIQTYRSPPSEQKVQSSASNSDLVSCPSLNSAWFPSRFIC